MSRDDGKYYSKLFDAIELVHSENMAIMSVLFRGYGVEEKDVNEIVNAWDEKFKDIRKW